MTQSKGFKFVTTLVLVFKKIESEDKTKYDTFYSHSKAEIIINESDIDDIFKSIYTTIISNTQKSLGKGSGWIIDSVINHTISISKYNPLAGSSYIKLPKELNHPRKRLINIENNDKNECFKSCWVRYLNPADHHPVRITKADKDFAIKLDFEDIKLPVKVRDIHKIEKNYSIAISVFSCEITKMCQKNVSKKFCEEKKCLFIINRRKKKTTLCSYQRFQKIFFFVFIVYKLLV